MLECRRKKIFSSGFALIEVLIATFLLAMVLFAFGQITSNSVNTKDRVIAEDREYLQMLTVFSRMQTDFEHAYSPLYFSKRFDPNPQSPDDVRMAQFLNSKYSNNKNFGFTNSEMQPIPIYKDPGPGQIEFFTFANRRKIENSKQSQFSWVSYQLKSNEKEEDGKVGLNSLMRQESANNIYSKDETLFEDVKSYPLANNIKELKFEFWEDKNRKWVSKLSEVGDGEYLLRGIKVNLTWQHSEGDEIEEERIFRPLFPYFIPENIQELEEGEIPSS